MYITDGIMSYGKDILAERKVGLRLLEQLDLAAESQIGSSDNTETDEHN
jgi:hypothetical protein